MNKKNRKLEEMMFELQRFNHLIDTYKPETKWEAANGRSLKYLIKERNSLEKAITKVIEKCQNS